MMPHVVRLSRTVAVLTALVTVPAARAQDTRTVSGTVVDSGGRFIPYASIDGGPRARAVSNGSGEFTLLIPPKDRIEVSVRRIGFLPTKFTVEAGGDTTIRVTMTQLAVLMNAQVIRAQSQVRTLEFRGFYDRLLEKERGSLVGDFIMPEEIEMRNPQRVSQLLEGKRGVTVRRTGGCNIIATCYRVMGTGDCPATIYLDGQRLNSLNVASNDPRGAPAIDELIPVTGVSAIELYPRGASAPPRYQALGGTCAVVLIWTK